MTNELGWIFPTLAIATWVGVPCYAAIARGRVYAIFAAVLLTAWAVFVLRTSPTRRKKEPAPPVTTGG